MNKTAVLVQRSVSLLSSCRAHLESMVEMVLMEKLEMIEKMAKRYSYSKHQPESMHMVDQFIHGLYVHVSMLKDVCNSRYVSYMYC